MKAIKNFFNPIKQAAHFGERVYRKKEIKDFLILVTKRLGLGLLPLIIISLLIFLGVELLPGDLASVYR